MSDSDFKWSDYDEYLTPAMLAGKQATLTILRIAVEEIFNPYRKRRMPCPVIYFSDLRKGLPMSASRRHTMAALFGDNPRDAIGKQVILRVVKSNQNHDTIEIVTDAGMHYEPFPDDDESPVESIGYRHQAETEAEVRNLPPGYVPPAPSIQIPSKKAERDIPKIRGLIQERVIDYGKVHFPTADNSLRSILLDAVRGGFRSENVTIENIGDFCDCLNTARTPKEEAQP